MTSAISVEHLAKSYRLGTIGGATLQGDLARWWARVRNRPDPTSKLGDERHAHRIGDTFWALRDVSFDVNRGDVVGIIGHNGAGKSTLLKILSQVTSPTSGEIRLVGRIASLLEVGTGFHPELTGRENIFLNGAILGMTKAEIRRRLDEIVAFSEIEQFISTPVKRYSSGMYVRLAFAVAAHLEPEILIIDEVLAVGDVNFQKKCIGKLQEVAEHGRTVLFVSHNMAAVKSLCSRAVLMDKGEVMAVGSAENVVRTYLNETTSSAYQAQTPTTKRTQILSAAFCTVDGTRTSDYGSGEPISLAVDIGNPLNEQLEVDCAFFDAAGNKLWNFMSTRHNSAALPTDSVVSLRLRFDVPRLNISELFVHVGLRSVASHVHHYVDHVADGLRCFITPTHRGEYKHTDTLFECEARLDIVGTS